MIAARRAASACAVTFAVGVALGGCAAPQRQHQESAAPFRDPGLTVQAARDRLRLGESHRSEVSATLGPATVVRFPSGFEVWTYRGHRDRRDAKGAEVPELVILFSPTGVVQKSRVRLPPNRSR